MNGVRVPDAVQRFFSGAPQSRDPGFFLAKLGPGSAAHRSAKSYALRCVRGTASRMQNHLAHRLAARQHFQRVGGLREREGAVDMR
jgi:hypothetical protein